MPDRLTASVQRHAAKIQWISIAVIVVALFLGVRALPTDRGIAALREQVAGLGGLGPVVYGAVYVVGALLFVPGTVLTLPAGAVFGLWVGTATVSAASTIAAALAFLVARHLARDAVAATARKSRRFRAIDDAIADGGTRVVALLRLSPAVPFSLGNYLFGLTRLRWLPYVLVSWLAMLPGTFLYVYLGYAGAQGLEVARGEAEQTSPLEWVALAIGLVATVVVTVLVTRTARSKLRAQTAIEDAADPGERQAGTSPPDGWPWRATALAAAAALAVAGAVWLLAHAADFAR